MIDKRDVVDTFQDRLGQLIARAQLSRAQFAATVGLDRSALSQILAPGAARLPRAERRQGAVGGSRQERQRFRDHRGRAGDAGGVQGDRPAHTVQRHRADQRRIRHR